MNKKKERKYELIIIISLVFLFVVSLFVANIMKENKQSIEENPNSAMDEALIDENVKAEDFTLTTIDGEEVSLSDYEGKNVLLAFFATWCPTCNYEMDELNKFSKTKNDNLEIIAVNLTSQEQSKEDVKKFVEEKDIQFNVLLDEDSELMEIYNIFTIPTNYLIDEKGNIVDVILGEITEKELSTAF